MKIKDRPEFKTKPKPMTCRADDVVSDAVKRMSEKNYGAVVVVDDHDQVLGLVTERDIMRRLVNEGRDPATTKVQEIMTAEVRTAREDDELVDWLRMMSNDRFRRLPIVDADGRLVSIMTQGDFVSYTWPELAKQAVTLARSTVSSNYPIVIIAVSILIYTLIVGTVFAGLVGG